MTNPGFPPSKFGNRMYPYNVPKNGIPGSTNVGITLAAPVPGATVDGTNVGEVRVQDVSPPQVNFWMG